jgi:hypothetical protein
MLPLHICIGEYQKTIHPKPNKRIMETKILVAGALLFTASAFAQTTDNAKNNQGTAVRTVAKSKTEARTKGTLVSTEASLKSQASLLRRSILFIETMVNAESAPAEPPQIRELRWSSLKTLNKHL